MNMPGFTAEAVFHEKVNSYWLNELPVTGTIVPAIPFCGNCDEILDRCAENGGRPRAVCRACETGNCFSGVERPPQLLDPFGHHPGLF